MLIPFDQIIYRQVEKGQPRPTTIVHINPEHVVSVNSVPTGESGQVMSTITLSSKGCEDEGNHEWVVEGDKDKVAELINTALAGMGLGYREKRPLTSQQRQLRDNQNRGLLDDA